MKSGTRPTNIDHRDRDFHRSFGSVVPQTFPQEYLCDAGLTMPDQESVNTFFIPPVPPLPYGCTDYTQSELATDLVLGKQVFNPQDIENITGANKNGGYDIRMSLLVAKALGWINGFYNIKTIAGLDYFDAFRLAQLVGAPEKRSISFGCPWFPSWEAAIQGNILIQNSDGSFTTRSGGDSISIIPMPLPSELATISKNPLAYGWHNSKLDGWKMFNNQLVYRDKSLQGKNIGDGGFIYFSRTVINVVMGIQGTVAFTATNNEPTNIVTIPVTYLQWIISIICNALGL